MGKWLYILLFVFSLFCNSALWGAEIEAGSALRGAEVEADSALLGAEIEADSVMRHLRQSALDISGVTPDYTANFYISGNMDILKRGNFIKSIPYLNLIDDGSNHYYAEFIGGLTFTNPNIYNQTLYSITHNKKRFFEEHMELVVAPNVKLNPYSQYIYGYIYSPLAYKSGKYYDFNVDSTWVENGSTFHKISFVPTLQSYKFITGHMVVSSRNWSVREMHFNGRMEFIEYEASFYMGNESAPDEFLPRKISMTTDVNILGTALRGDYSSVINYEKIAPRRITTGVSDGREELDLTLLYNHEVDTLSSLARQIVSFRDSLSREESGNSQTKEEVVGKKRDRGSSRGAFGKFMVRNHSLDLREVGELRFSPIVSPILFHYSTSHGLSYTQKLRYMKSLSNDKYFALQPRIGYNFKYNEFYWGMQGEINYAPRRLGKVFMDVGNDNKLFARSKEAQTDSISETMNGFRSSYAMVGHKVEIANGFTISTNVALRQYIEIHNSTNRYTAFVPEVELQYTPHQYYYMDGDRKTYLYSRYPTFTLNFAHAFKGVMSSTTRYNRLEFDMQQKVAVGPMHTLHYRVGFGLFYDYEHLYFAQFNNLKRNILPEGWEDDIGGSFHLLNTVQYNEIDKYLRANVKYDAPLLLVPTLLRNVKYITKERLYCNMLLVDVMDPYVELGYGIGTNIFNVGLFWGGEVTKWDKVGIKFTFEIFN
ncbi:MAG: hypothetical protein E7110_08335 [Bacteroidales bacterium]|nr:hypothetical protein [Bacteroidales bacterium]